MKTAAVVIDNWKLPIFVKHLDKAGYSYTVHPKTVTKITVLRVQYEWVSEIQPIIEAANKECSK
jgi:hypothetical protein